MPLSRLEAVGYISLVPIFSPSASVSTVVRVVQDNISNGLFGAGKRGTSQGAPQLDREDQARLQASLQAIRLAGN